MIILQNDISVMSISSKVIAAAILTLSPLHFRLNSLRWFGTLCVIFFFSNEMLNFYTFLQSTIHVPQSD